jgi:NTE family protein
MAAGRGGNVSLDNARHFDMALLAPPRTGIDTIFPDSLKRRLATFNVLHEVGDAAIRRLLAEADWFGLPGGTELPRDGENDRAVFLVVAGSLAVFVDDEGEQKRRLVATIPAGEMVGEMSVITGEEHSATLVAVRDSELLRLGPQAFDALLSRHPRVMFNLLKIVVRRLRETTRSGRQQSRPKTFAVIPLQRGLQNEPVARSIVDALKSMGAKAALLDSSASDETTEWFNRFESAHDIVFYQGDEPDSTWTNFCWRQADRVLLIARADERMPLHPFEQRFFMRPSTAPAELLLLHGRSGKPGSVPQHIELRNDLYATHHHVRLGDTADIKRLARFTAGTAVNIVLAGGGARGFAHIGVLKALKEAGVPFDFVGGTSMGGIVAAGVAMEWDIDELRARVRDAFVDNNPLSDFTLPLIALFKGRQVTKLLRKHFGDTRIEDMAKPYFCVSSDLTTGRDYIHRRGLLWRALRASVALPGILPPVTTEEGHLLVDGGVMNNLPIDVMAQEARGPIIAVDVSGEIDLRADDERYGERSLLSLITQRMRGSPSIISILMRAGTVGSNLQRKSVHSLADYLYEPPLSGIGMRDWKNFDQTIAQGYAFAALEIEKNGVPLSDTWTSGPAVAVRPVAAQ